MTIKEQATNWGHAPVGKLHRAKDYKGHRIWIDDEGVEYVTDHYNRLLYIVSEDWII